MFTENAAEIRHVVLLGLMGVGKTTIGRLLSERLQWPLDDSDASIQKRCGATVRELSARLGVDGMHRLEAEHLMAGLRAGRPTVLCAAASTVDSAECRAALRDRHVFAVWLQADVETLVAHFATGPHRPVLDVDTEALFRHQIADRSQRFAEVARLRVDVQGQPPASSAAQIAAALAQADG